jgi:hypothetical protein
MNRITSTAAAFLLAATAFASVGCDEGDDGMVGGKAYPKTGSNVHVQLRRDYLGLNSVTGMPMVGAMGEGAAQPVAASGTLKRVTDEFVVLQIPGDERRELWIPRDAVLMMDVTRPAQ